ncbi:hypothetical protein L1987_14679 [Smallanthus sonchifolius]|uniref:Uncharacterized protein n=1 Tax=Smallanthus sonchifolius TaxID=185202 RepID=A0ACB9J4I5_9ASTR|nr:hypothetical protein L1987_14679 [Smallanthus sonchifolius]
MILTVKTFLQNEGWIALEDFDSDLSLPSSPKVVLNTEELSSRWTKLKVMTEWKSVMGEDEEEDAPPLSTPQLANEAYAEASIATPSSAIVVYEAEVEASNKEKGKGIMTEEEEKKIKEENREIEIKRREREEEEEMAQLKKDQERKAAMLFREQQIQLAVKSLDATKVHIPVASQIEEDEALALQLQE